MKAFLNKLMYCKVNCALWSEVLFYLPDYLDSLPENGVDPETA